LNNTETGAEVCRGIASYRNIADIRSAYGILKAHPDALFFTPLPEMKLDLYVKRTYIFLT